MKLASIHHIAVIVSDYEKSRDFYVNVLGFPILSEHVRPERNDVILNLKVNETTQLELFAMPTPPARVTRPEACGLRHLAFEVADIEATVRELASHGVACEPIRTDPYTGNRMTFFSDPDGLPLELQQKNGRA